MHNWLSEDLSNVDRTKTPWVAVAHHRQIYLGGGLSGGGIMKKMQTDLEPLFIKGGVDLVIAAHGKPRGLLPVSLYQRCNHYCGAQK